MVGFTSNRHLTGFAKSLHCLSRSLPAVLVAAALVWTAGSTLTVYPHQLAYFNEFAGGPENGHRHLLHSSIDWGQDLLYLRQCLEEQGHEAPPCYLVAPSFNNIPVARLVLDGGSNSTVASPVEIRFRFVPLPGELDRASVLAVSVNRTCWDPSTGIQPIHPELYRSLGRVGYTTLLLQSP